MYFVPSNAQIKKLIAFTYHQSQTAVPVNGLDWVAALAVAANGSIGENVEDEND